MATHARTMRLLMSCSRMLVSLFDAIAKGLTTTTIIAYGIVSELLRLGQISKDIARTTRLLGLCLRERLVGKVRMGLYLPSRLHDSRDVPETCDHIAVHGDCQE